MCSPPGGFGGALIRSTQLVPIVLTLAVFMLAPMSPPAAQAAQGETPTILPLGPSTDTFRLHVAEDIWCQIAVRDEVGASNIPTPTVYATNSETDDCADTDPAREPSFAVTSTQTHFVSHVLTGEDSPIELAAGEHILASIWLWVQDAGGVSPSFKMEGPGFSRIVDTGAVVAPADIELAPGERIYTHFPIDFGPAPATIDGGVLRLTITISKTADEVRSVAPRVGLSLGDGHPSRIFLPADTQDPTPVVVDHWPPTLESATVRPGVQTSSATGQCTANFVYRDIVTTRIYIGTAAHCVDGLAIGSNVIVRGSGGLGFTGSLAFSSWQAIGFTPGAGGVGDDIHPFDFGLILIPEEHESKVHPATLHFGGPTGLRNPLTMDFGDKVIGYGASGLRLVRGPGDWHEGYTRGTANSGWTLEVVTVTPGIPGDSGSGIMDKDGGAIGAASYITLLPVPGINGFSSIPRALDYLHANGWPDLELQTWELIDPGVAPAPLG